jgi:hypothetical protein
MGRAVGFMQGAAKVQPLSEGPRYDVITVDTQFRHVQIGVSPTGRVVRVWVDGEEALPPVFTRAQTEKIVAARPKGARRVR